MKDLLKYRRDLHFARALPGLAGLLPSGFEFALKAVAVERHAGVFRNFFGQVDGKAEGVVQLKRLLAGNDTRAISAMRLDQGVEFAQPLMQSVEKALFLAEQQFGDK